MHGKYLFKYARTIALGSLEGAAEQGACRAEGMPSSPCRQGMAEPSLIINRPGCLLNMPYGYLLATCLNV